MLAGIFGAFPVNASPPRTGIVVRDRRALAALGPVPRRRSCWRCSPSAPALLQHVPDAALGGILLFVALRIIRVKQIVHDLSPVARRIPADPRDRGADHRAADPAGRRARHHPVAAARHLEHDARASSSNSSACPAPRSGGRPHPHIAGERVPGVAVVGLQAPLSFLNAPTFRTDVSKLVQAREAASCWCWKPAAWSRSTSPPRRCCSS